MSGSVSNHWPRKSAALIVISCTNTACCVSGSFWNERSRPPRGRNSRGSRPVGSGGTMPRIGLMKRAISTIRRPYSSYASASSFDQRRSSRIVRP